MTLGQTPENLSISQTVSTFGIGRTKLFYLISVGEIEAIKLGRRTLIPTDSVRRYVAQLPRVSAR